MDFANIGLEPEATMHVKDIRGALAYDDDGSPITITLMSDDAEPVQRQQREAVNRRMGLKRGQFKLDMAGLDEEGLDKLAVATVRWQGIKSGGEPMPCDFKTVRALYAQHRWLREQVDEFVADRTNFLNSSLRN